MPHHFRFGGYGPADDTAIVGLLNHGDDDSSYFDSIGSMVEWCKQHNLPLNASKTKEIIINFSKTLQ